MNYLINQVIQGTCRGLSVPRFCRTIQLALVVALLCSCASVPHTGRRQFNIVSDGQINALAARAFNEVIQKEPESKDEQLNTTVKRVSTRIRQAAEVIDKPSFDWDVRVIEKDEPNAFCLPGGKIVVNSGILRYAKNEAELAAIIAHEVAHATARHGAERLSQKFALDGALNLGTLALKDKAGALTERARLILSALGLGGVVGVVLPYSRVHEFEADRIGQIYMARAGYDPAEAVRLWERLSGIRKHPVPIWLSTHPADQDRVKQLREFLPDAQKHYESAPEKHGKGRVFSSVIPPTPLCQRPRERSQEHGANMQQTSQEMRTFVAIELPEGVKAFLKELVARLRSFGGDVRWTRVESMHLTLKFLGNIPMETVNTLAVSLRPFFGRQERLPLTVAGTGGFPSLNKPRVIWAGLRDTSGRLVPMVSELERIMEPLGFEKERRVFSPHLTLGRVKGGIGGSELVEALRQMQAVSGPSFVADRAFLFQSILKPSGAQYVPLERFDFSSG